MKNRTRWTLVTDALFRIGMHTPLLSRWARWRRYFAVVLYHRAYRRIARPWLDGYHWTTTPPLSVGFVRMERVNVLLPELICFRGMETRVGRRTVI